MPAPSISNYPTAAAKSAHINMLTDAIISSLPPEGLRSVMRSILASNSTFTKEFEIQSRKWLQSTASATIPRLFSQCSEGTARKATISPEFGAFQRRIRAMTGVGLGFEALSLLSQIVLQSRDLDYDEESEEGEALMDVLASVDGDIVQAVTSASKELLVEGGKRQMSALELDIQRNTLEILEETQRAAEAKGKEFMFERGLSVMEIENF